MAVRVRVDFITLSKASGSGFVDNTISAVLSAQTLVVGNPLTGSDRLRVPQFSARYHVGHVRITPLDGQVLVAWGADEQLVVSDANGLLILENVSEVVPVQTHDYLSLMEFV